ncbi:S41 family peptidase [Xanthovirga aplysinae]|uniref:S41 family peptidase n=1 Tax=Xanthovirga aplysinae TaxID=2529853 RepID=UPI0012BBDAA6|nr:S41 family peptidase [Xanthovirga aplysinae]MTI32658.1 hypothetical protein [Xanthovirga aplysinae]
MKTKLTLLCLMVFTPLLLLAQSQSKNEVIREVQKLMIENYIFLEKAHEVNQHLDQLIQKEYFEGFESSEAFAKALSEEMQKITKDKHLNIAPPRPRNTGHGPRPSFYSWHLNNLMEFRAGGFGEVNFFEGNVGYIHLKGFRVEDTLKVDPLMQYLATADAIIVDLRENSGGNGPVGTYLSSYFLPLNIPLTGVYTRKTNRLEEYHTVPVKGMQRLDVPLLILTSNRTFSAAEAFAYDLQARNRAIIIGENTGGGAHPVSFIRLPKNYTLIVTVARSINPVTQTNWEGVGVKPDIKVSAEKALEEAKKVAIESAKKYRETPFRKLEKILKNAKLSKADEKAVCDLLELILERGHMEKFMLNRLGYDYLDRGKVDAALAVLRAGTVLFPNSPNAHDSYAEVLTQNGQKKLALMHYERAVLRAKNQNDRQLELFEKNLNAFKAKR